MRRVKWPLVVRSLAVNRPVRGSTGIRAWFLQELREGPSEPRRLGHTAPWWQVMCLTGVDYFSSLGYQPSIAFTAAGFLSPLATLVLVGVTLFGALPVYSRIAALSPRGQGSLSVLEERLPRWRGKAFVLCLLGFAATDFVITITLSAADATAHVLENPFVPHWLDHPILFTLLLVSALGAIFLKGFREAIWVAVMLVGVYLFLNVIVVGRELEYVVAHGEVISIWSANLLAQEPRPWMIAVLVIWFFPKLALGLSGFETGVAVMPLVSGARQDRRAGPGVAHREHAQTAGDGRDHHVDAAHLQLDHRRDAGAEGGARRGRQRERTRARVPRPPGLRRVVRHDLRHLDDFDPLVRRRVRHGRPAEPGAEVPAALRHGAGLGARDAAAGDDHHGHRRAGDHPVRRERRETGRRVCHRRADADDFGGRGGDALDASSAASASRSSPSASSTRRSSTSSSGPRASRSRPGSS